MFLTGARFASLVTTFSASKIACEAFGNMNPSLNIGESRQRSSHLSCSHSRPSAVAGSATGALFGARRGALKGGAAGAALGFAISYAAAAAANAVQSAAVAAQSATEGGKR